MIQQVRVVRHDTKKPDGMQYVIDALKIPASEIVVIGDRVGRTHLLARFLFD